MTIDLSERGRGVQYRSFDLDECEVRENSDTGGFTFEGVASVVGKTYTVRDKYGEFRETIEPGAFDRVIDHATRSTNAKGKLDIGFYIDHRHGDIPMATTRAKTLQLRATPNLHVHAELDPARPDVQIARSVVSRGEYREMSVGFKPTASGHKETWSKDMTERRIHEMTGMFDVSIVREGAGIGTSGEFRSFDDWLESLADVEMGEAEIRRAFAHFQSLLPEETIEEVIEERTESGLFVTDDLRRLWDQRARPAA
jgi:HK97 family phage prohead protease